MDWQREAKGFDEIAERNGRPRPHDRDRIDIVSDPGAGNAGETLHAGVPTARSTRPDVVGLQEQQPR